jgi:ATP adenylyltransferase
MRCLWAPWRMDYILEQRQKGCLFCRKLAERKDEENLILYRAKYSFTILNKFPYNNGHLMVVPKFHHLHLEDLNEKELQEIAFLLKASTQVLKKNFHPHGFNIGMNIGNIAGAGEEHLHFHIVPRWAGDTNFMPVLGESKVIPQYLEKTYQALHPAMVDFFRKKERPKGGRKK